MPALATVWTSNLDALKCRDRLIDVSVTDYLLSDSQARRSLAVDNEAVAAACRTTEPNLGSEAARRRRVLADAFRGDYAAAQAMLDQSLQGAPHDYWYQYMAGLIAHASGQTDEAVTSWVRLDPSGKLLLEVGQRLSELKELDRATDYFRAAAFIYPDWGEANLALAEALFAAKESEQAATYYDRGFATLSLPLSTRAVYLPAAADHYARLLMDQRRYKEAARALEQALTWKPGHPPYLARLAQTYAAQEDFASAERWLDELVRSSPSDGNGYWEYGNYFTKRRMYPEAATQFEKAVEVEPEGPATFYGSLALAYLRLAQPQKAIPLFEEALRRQPENAGYESYLAEARKLLQTGE